MLYRSRVPRVYFRQNQVDLFLVYKAVGFPVANLKSEYALAKSWFSTSKCTKRRVLLWNTAFLQFQIRVSTCINRFLDFKTLKRRALWWNIAFVQFNVIVDSCINRVFHCATLKNTCFAIKFSHVCNFKSELALVRSWFSTADRTKRRILWWNTAFVQFQVIVDTCTDRVFHGKTLKKRWFVVAFKVRVDSCTNLMFYRKILKKTFFAVEYRSWAISSQGWHLHISDFRQQNTKSRIL